MLKNNPYILLEKEEIPKTLLSENAIRALSLYEETLSDVKEFPDDKKMKKEAEAIAFEIVELIKEDIARIKGETHDEIAETEKKNIKHVQSKKVVEKASHVLDDLALCRLRLKEDRIKRVENGEIKVRKKKTLVTKLRQQLLSTATLIPAKLKDDLTVIERTEKAVLKFLNELKTIWGLNKIKPIEDDLKEKFKKLQESAS